MLLISELEGGVLTSGFAVADAKYDDLSITSLELRSPGPARLLGRGNITPASDDGIMATDLHGKKYNK